MKQISSVLLLAMTICPAEYLAAQHANDSTLNRTVVVENQYNPEVMDAFKVNVLPKVEEPTVEKKDIEYASTSQPLTAWPFVPMDVITSPQQQRLAQRGYFRVAYGSLNNVDVKGTYLWNPSETDQLGVMGSLYGFSGKINGYNTNVEKWDSRFFRTDLSADYKHDARKVRFMLGGNFASQAFSYMPIYTSSTSQRFTMGDGYIGIASRKGTAPVDFGAQAGFKIFNVSHDLSMYASNEKQFFVSGYMGGSLDETSSQKVKIELSFDGFNYSGVGQEVPPYQPNYVQAMAHPWYELSNDALRLRLGVKVAWQNKAGSGFMFAPDVQFDLKFADTYQFFVRAEGGPELSTMRRLNQLSPYWSWGASNSLVTTNTAVDACLGVKGSPRPGVSFRLSGGYKYIQDDLFVNPTPWIEASFRNSDEMPYDALSNIQTHAFIRQNDSQSLYLNATFSYGYKDLVDLSAEGTYYSWTVNADDKERLLFLKQELQFGLSLRAKVYRELYAQARYQYESRANVTSSWGRADAINNLTLSAGYEFANRLNVFIRFDNVLNQYYLTSAGYPVQGFTAMGGLSVRF